MKQILKQITVSMASIALACGLLLSSYAVPAELARAATLSEYDKTSIEDDLKGVDLSAYKKDEAGEAQLINELGFMEYAYSEDAAVSRKYYGLYFYVYNPRTLTLSTRSGANVVNMAVTYDAAGEPTGYANLSLTYLDCTDDGLFYKFRLSDPSAAYSRAKAYAAAHGKRRYDIAGIQLWEAGKQNAEDHAVSKTFTVTGYASGCASDPDAESTLDIRGTQINVIELELHGTTYRFPYINENGAGHQNQIDSVYFAIDKGFNEKYGKLYRVKCCWDEQKTTPIIVTNRQEVYDDVLAHLGTDGSGGEYHIYDRYSATTMGTSVANAAWAYNLGNVLAPVKPYVGYVFKSEEKNITDADITSAEMKKWIYGHEGADYLFLDSVDEGRTKGYQEHTFTADEPFNMLTFNQTASGWDKFSLNWQKFWTGKSWDFGPEQQDPVDPIRLIGDSDFTGNDTADAQNLFVHKNDFEEFERFYDDNKSTKNVFLLRFAVTDYYSNLQTVFGSGFFSTADDDSTYTSISLNSPSRTTTQS